MLSLELGKKVEDLLEELAAKEGLSTQELACRAILEKMEELEDIAALQETLAEDDGTRFSLDDVRMRLEEREHSTT